MFTQIPIVIALTSFTFLLSIIGYLCQIKSSLLILSIGFILLGIFISLWVLNLINEYFRSPNLSNESCFIKGFYLFIITEIFFFFSFFWAYYDFSIDITYYIGGIWPPQYIVSRLSRHTTYPVSWMNTYLIFISLIISIGSYTVGTSSVLDLIKTRLHVYSNHSYVSIPMVVAIIIPYICGFINLHIGELQSTIKGVSLAINNGIYASIYYAITGLHGIHVIIGTCFVLLLFLIDKINNIFIIATFYYWHLIDIVWLFVLNTQYIHYITKDLIFFYNNIIILDTIIPYA